MAVLHEHTRALLRRLVEGADDRMYVRFGRVPRDGISKNHVIRGTEAGISVYATRRLKSGKGWLLLDPDFGKATYDTTTGSGYYANMIHGTLKDRIIEGAIYLVRGTRIKKKGADGEPLLRTAEIVSKLKPEEVFLGALVLASEYDADGVWLRHREVENVEPLPSLLGRDPDPIGRLRAEALVEMEETAVLERLGMALTDAEYKTLRARSLGYETLRDALWTKFLNAKLKQRGKVSPL